MSPKVSIVIRCFNEVAHIGRLLSGVSEQTLTAPEIIIVDSGSTDGTLDVARSFPVKILSINPAEFSFGRSLNVGCRAATGDVIVVASAHVYPVYNDWLDALVKPFADERVAVSYGRQRGFEKTQYAEHQIFARWFPAQSNPNQDHPFSNNANAAVRRTVWEKLHYDETLTGLEDLDFAHRAMALGHRIAYVAGAEIVHVHSETWRQIYTRYRREAIAFHRIFQHERFRFADFARLATTNILSDYYHALRDHLLHRCLVSIPAFRLAQFWGTYRGFQFRGPITNQLKQTFYYPRGLSRQPETAMASEEQNGARRAIEYRREPIKASRD